MFNLFSDHINSDFDFLKKSKLLVCLSGGVDSMVLIDLLRRSNYDVSVAHCNFKLRGDECDLDEKFVKKYCFDNSIQFFSKSFITKLPNHSLQMAARTLRYDWFNELLKNNNKDYILTAHHLDDSLETFIINLSRASGIEGFTGISPVNDKIVRPLTIFSKKQILEYAKNNKIHWREDSTNKKDDYQRNYIRNQIIPLLKKLYPNFLSQSKKTMNFLKNSQLVIDKYIEAVKKEKFVIKNDEITIEKKFIQCNKNDIYNLFKDYGFKNPSEILMLCNSISGKIIESVSHVLLSDRTNLILKKKSKEYDQVIKVDMKGIDDPVRICIKTGDFVSKSNSKSIFISKNDIKFPLYLRKLKKGDLIYPLGMKGKKLISKYFKDEKMSFFDKQNQWLLCNNNEVMWIVGQRADRRYYKSKGATLKIELL